MADGREILDTFSLIHKRLRRLESCCVSCNNAFTGVKDGAWDTVPGRRRDDNWTNPWNNPHCRQVCDTLEYNVNPLFTRTLLAEAPEKPYQSRNKEFKSVIHWGQRKLLMSEIEFLTMYGTGDQTVVYAGAAPGTHITYLAELFPTLRFVLVDPAPFTVKETDRITIINDLFTDALARQLHDQHERILFVSDIRRADPFQAGMTSDEVERIIKEDNAMQRGWHTIMEPERSMLKFRLPWDDGRTEYLDGDVYLPVWGPVTTTETRLITHHKSVQTKWYDNRKYESQMFYFNRVTRPSLFEHDVRGEGIDHCYDCRAEIHILSEYLKRCAPAGDISRHVSEMSETISRRIAGGRTLRDPNPDPEDRRRRIRDRQYKDGMPAHEAKRHSELKLFIN